MHSYFSLDPPASAGYNKPYSEASRAINHHAELLATAALRVLQLHALAIPARGAHWQVVCVRQPAMAAAAQHMAHPTGRQCTGK